MPVGEAPVANAAATVFLIRDQRTEELHIQRADPLYRGRALQINDVLTCIDKKKSRGALRA